MNFGDQSPEIRRNQVKHGPARTGTPRTWKESRFTVGCGGGSALEGQVPRAVLQRVLADRAGTMSVAGSRASVEPRHKRGHEQARPATEYGWEVGLRSACLLCPVPCCRYLEPPRPLLPIVASPHLSSSFANCMHLPTI